MYGFFAVLSLGLVATLQYLYQGSRAEFGPSAFMEALIFMLCVSTGFCLVMFAFSIKHRVKKHE